MKKTEVENLMSVSL